MLHSDSGPHILGLLRIIIFGSWFIIILFFSPFAYSSLPLEAFEPWGIYRLSELFSSSTIDVLVSYTSIVVLKVLLLVTTSLCFLGIRPFKLFALLTFILLIYLDFVTRGFNGFINHAQLGIYYGAFVILFFPASDALTLFKKNSIDKNKDSFSEYSFPVILIALLLTLGYSFIGINRIVYGGFEIFKNDALLIYILKNSLLYSQYGFDIGIKLIQYDVAVTILKIGFFVVTVAEIVSPFILFNDHLRRIWLIVIIPFHFITLFTMNIFFWENILLILVLFIRWELLFKKRKLDVKLA